MIICQTKGYLPMPVPTNPKSSTIINSQGKFILDAKEISTDGVYFDSTGSQVDHTYIPWQQSGFSRSPTVGDCIASDYGYFMEVPCDLYTQVLCLVP